MANIFDRLQFVKHEEIFATREDAYNYVINKQIFERPSLVAEPMILLYESDDAVKGPNVILAIGSVGNGVDSSTDNRTFFIDTQKTEEEIEELRELIEQAIKSLTIIPVDSETLDLSVEKTDEGTFLSGDVKIADYTIASGKVQNNIITVEEGKGLYAFVDMDYDPETFVITFNVNGVIKNFQLPPDQHVEKGWYSPADEALFLKLADGSKVKIDVVKLIDEWTVLSSASTTPIMLFKEHVSAYTEEHDGVYDWQDLLTADVRVADHINDNILHKDRTGRYLYVKGTADNIKYKNGLTVADALDNVDTKVSTSAGNMIYRRPDGLFASAMLDYNSAENKLIYRYTDTQTEDFKEVSFTLNSVKILQDITYDPVKEVIVIRYIDAQGEYQRVEIPAKDIIEEWIVNNEAHNIELVKYRSEGQGKDILSADAKIHAGDNNILEDKDHKLYVNGISDNIKYDVTGDTTVKDVLDGLSGKTIETDARLDAEIERAKAAEEALGGRIDQEISDREADVDAEQTRAEAAEEVLTNKIGTGFTDDPHENVTYKFEALSAKVDSEIERSTTKDDELEVAIAAEQARATSAETVLDGRVDAIEEEIGDGFGPRNTVRDEIDNLQSEIDAVSADSTSSIKDIINEDKSIEIDKTNPTKPVIGVKISEHEGNTIRLIQQEGSEGLSNFVDLTYDSEHNKLTFTKSTTGTTDIVREIQLQSISFIDEIYYDKNTEELVIVYYSGHDRKEMRIPLRDLIDEWDVYNDVHSAVVLTKEWNEGLGKYILSAEASISEKEDNILENQEGELYVSSSAITANAAAIQAEVERATEAEGQLADDIDALSGAIDTEVERATTAEGTLQTNIDNEASRATGAEETLQQNIDAEQTRAEAAEEVLTNKIGTGFTDNPYENVTYRFEALSDKLDTEIADRIADVNEEQTRAEAAEQTLATNLVNEVTRAENAEQTLSGAIETETTRAEAAEQALSRAIDSEVERATEAERVLQSNIDAENLRAISAETTLQTAITNEASRAASEETRLEHLIEDEASARVNADNTLQNSINSEVSRARETENRIETALNNEISRAQVKEGELNTAITNETLRAQEADNELYQKIADEKSSREIYDSVLDSKIDTEKSRAQVVESTLSGMVTTETINRENADNVLTNAIANEATERQTAVEELRNSIEAATLTFEDTKSVDFVKDENNKVIANVKLANSPDNIILIDDAKEGLYASVDFNYEPATNKIKFNVNGAEKEFTIAAGSILEDAWYDSVTKELVFKTKTADGQYVDVKVPAYDLFDEWYVVNPPTDSAIELTKVTGRTDPTTHEPLPDELSGRVLISPLEDNLLTIDTNGLYVSGEGSAVAECANKKADKLYNILYGDGSSMSECGESSSYIRGTGCIISAATSFSEADQMLNDAFCSFIDDWEVYGFDTPSTHTDWLKIGQNRHMLVDVRLSHGVNGYDSSGMTDDELLIKDFKGDYIDPTGYGFSDTNVLRIVSISQGKSGEPLEADNKYNGVYLSNVWDCGLYYGLTEADIAAKAAAEAAGFVTDYSTDEDASASGFNYMNNVRQTDIPTE